MPGSARADAVHDHNALQRELTHLTSLLKNVEWAYSIYYDALGRNDVNLGELRDSLVSTLIQEEVVREAPTPTGTFLEWLENEALQLEALLENVIEQLGDVDARIERAEGQPRRPSLHPGPPQRELVPLHEREAKFWWRDPERDMFHLNLRVWARGKARPSLDGAEDGAARLGVREHEPFQPGQYAPHFLEHEPFRTSRHVWDLREEDAEEEEDERVGEEFLEAALPAVDEDVDEDEDEDEGSALARTMRF